MFWRFGFANASSIDSLLDREDVALEAILDEDDLLQECKAQNTRLMTYFERVDVLQKLFGYVTGQIESEEKGRFKYPYVATEVLCSEIWSIVETCIAEQAQLLVPFWETVLDRSPDDMKTQMIMASHFAKITSAFLTKKPVEMLAFIQSQPSIVERLLRHIETPAFPEIFSRIIELDDRPGGNGVLEWLSSQNFIGRLIDLLSLEHTSDVHAVVSDLLKSIISLANPSPGAGLTDGLQNGPSSNRFARELAERGSLTTLVGYMLYDFRSIPDEDETPHKPSDSEDLGGEGEGEADSSFSSSSSSLLSSSHPSPPLPTRTSATSSITNSISVVVELIRKHNSDYFEPYLFHTLRNRLIQIQQSLDNSSEDGRETLELAMKEMVDRMGVVHLGPLLEVMSARLEEFKGFLKSPRSLSGPISTTVGPIIPLTFERYRICELFAELLHCSNMALLNRPAAFARLYDPFGRLQGGLAALEELANVIGIGQHVHDPMDEAQDDIEPALELPVSRSGRTHGSPESLLDSDEDMSGDEEDGEEPGSSDDDEAMEEIAMYDEPGSLELSPLAKGGTLELPPVPSSPMALSSPAAGASTSGVDSGSIALSPGRTTTTDRNSEFDVSPTPTPPPRSPARSHASRRSSKRGNTMESSSTEGLVPIGEQFKRRFLNLDLLSTVLDLFFEFPWNNFLHSAVYDVVHQVLTGNVESGLNRELAISLFRDAKIMQRIVDGQKRNDVESAKPKGVRLGYMGHLTLISEDVLTAVERFPPDLRLIIMQYAPEPEWEHYVTGRYNETKNRDARLLGGGKPVVDSGSGGRPKWIDEEEGAGASGSGSGGGVRGEFRRASSVGPSRESSADFGPAPMDEEDEEDGEEEHRNAPQFAHYLAQEMHTPERFSTSDDDDDDDEGWLTHSNFSLSHPPVSSRRQSTERRPLSHAFDDAFGSDDAATRAMVDDPFSPNEDDGFGPFNSDSSGSTSDPFNFPSSFPDDMEDSAFDDNFGDFGDFQSAEDAELDGELTPTTGSWTLAGSDPGIPNESIAEDFGLSGGSGHAHSTSRNEDSKKPSSSTSDREK